MESVALRIEKSRKIKGLGQKDLAKITGIHPTSIGQYERGVIVPPPPKLAQMANALDVSIEWLTYGSPEVSTTSAPVEVPVSTPMPAIPARPLEQSTIEHLIQVFEKQLAEKDEMLRRLTRMLEMSMGKPMGNELSGAPIYPLLRVVEADSVTHLAA